MSEMRFFIIIFKYSVVVEDDVFLVLISFSLFSVPFV